MGEGLEWDLWLSRRHVTTGSRHLGLGPSSKNLLRNFPACGDGGGGRAPASGASSESWIPQAGEEREKLVGKEPGGGERRVVSHPGDPEDQRNPTPLPPCGWRSPLCPSLWASRGPPELHTQRRGWKRNPAVSATYLLYCRWRWIFPPAGRVLAGGGFSGSLGDETTPDPLVTKPLSHRVPLWEGKSFLLSNLCPDSCLCSTAFLYISPVIWADLG